MAGKAGVSVVAVCGSLAADPDDYAPLGLRAVHEVRRSRDRHDPAGELEHLVRSLHYFRG